MSQWTPKSWRTKPILQQPPYPDLEALRAAESTLSQLPPLVFGDEIRALQDQLAQASLGKAFVLQTGDCAESFNDLSSSNIKDTFKIILQMSAILTFAGRRPVIKIGRIAGQFAKPRSSDTEKKDGLVLQSYRGDMINGEEFSSLARTPDPQRMLKAYHQSTSTLNLVRAFANGGLADLNKIQRWNLSFVETSPLGKQYQQLADRIQDAIDFMAVCGVNSINTPALRETTLYTSHEALLLNYEEPLIRQDEFDNKFYACSAHMLWIGERTRQLGGAHVEMLRGLSNPLGIKIGSSTEPEGLLALITALNPDNIPGRLTLITRMGHSTLAQKLPALIKAVAQKKRSVVWSCDPMHGNTETTRNGTKTRSFDNILAEIKVFFDTLTTNGAHPGGIHLEMTGQDVTECTGGAQQISEDDLARCYLTQCDPRLNADQSLELAFIAAEYLRNHTL